MRRWQINSSNTCWAVICTPSSSLLNTKVKETRIRKLTTHSTLILSSAFPNWGFMPAPGSVQVEPSACENQPAGIGEKNRYLSVSNRWWLAAWQHLLMHLKAVSQLATNFLTTVVKLHQWSLFQHFAENLSAVCKCSAELRPASAQAMLHPLPQRQV